MLIDIKGCTTHSDGKGAEVALLISQGNIK